MDDIKTIYFSHPKVHYNEDIEMDCIVIIGIMIDADEDIEIMNPNQKWLSDLYMERKKAGDKNPFEIFREIARSCDIIVGVTYTDGVIGAGVHEELEEGLKAGKDVYLIYMNKYIKLFLPYASQNIYKVLSIAETSKRNKEGKM